MNIAVSNLAWESYQDKQIFELMRNLKIHSLEISPFRDSANLSVISDNSALLYIEHLKKYHIQVVALQGLLFSFPELVIFKDIQTRKKTFNHLVKVINFAHLLGAKAVIFGSPKNKVRGTLGYDKAFSIAVDFFGQLAQQASKQNITICIEPTPGIYGSDFINNTTEAISLIKAINSSSLKLNLDLGALISNNEDAEQTIMKNDQNIGHIHISEPHLKLINFDNNFHQKVIKAIKASSYRGVISIEMLPQPSNNIESIFKTLSFISKLYTL